MTKEIDSVEEVFAVENVNVIIHRKTFNTREVSTIGAIIAPANVNITNNIFEEEDEVKFASREYLIVRRRWTVWRRYLL